MSTAYVVETSGLTKRFGERVALDDVDLRVPRGSAFGYLRPNGAGKTTLIRLLLGLTRATAGTMRLLGRPVPAERATATILIGSNDGVRAQALLAAHPAVRSAAQTAEGIRVTLRPGFPMSAEDAAADINRCLVEARLAVHRVEPARASLEERFLESTDTRGALFGILALVVLAAAMTGCGIGRASNDEKVSKTATTYLRALADGDSAKACAQLTRRAEGGCEAAMRRRLSRLQADALTRAADSSIDIDLHDNTATAGLSEPKGARFVLKKVGSEWLIDSGYTLTTAGTSSELTKPQYQALLMRANARIQTTETAAEKAAFAPLASHARAAGALERWAGAEATNARILAAANPPAAARKPNALLVSAERLEAANLQHLARIVRTTPGAGHVMQIAQRTMTPRAGALLDRAIAQLHKLGYR